MLRATPDTGGQRADDGALGNPTPPSILRHSPRAPSRFPQVDYSSIPIAAALPRHNATSGQSGVIAGCASLGAIRAPRTNTRDLIQIGTRGRWMLVFIRAICAHAEAGQGISWNRQTMTLEQDACEGKLVV
jgi:hypothetical protein